MSLRPTIRVKKKGSFEKLAGKLHNLFLGPSRVEVGFPEGKSDQDNINKALWNEFGTRGGASGGGWGGPIQERPFMRNGVRKTKATIKGKIPSLAQSLFLGKAEKHTILGKIGLQGQQDIQAAIDAMTTPENKESTVKLKGSSHPLIDTGELRQAVTWKIEE